MEIKEFKNKYDKHFELLDELRKSINQTTELLKLYGRLPETEYEIINEMYLELLEKHIEVVQVFK